MYPSTDTSSIVVVGCLVIQVVSVWWGTRDDFALFTYPVNITDGEKEHDE